MSFSTLFLLFLFDPFFPCFQMSKNKSPFALLLPLFCLFHWLPHFCHFLALKLNVCAFVFVSFDRLFFFSHRYPTTIVFCFVELNCIPVLQSPSIILLFFVSLSLLSFYSFTRPFESKKTDIETGDKKKKHRNEDERIDEKRKVCSVECIDSNWFTLLINYTATEHFFICIVFCFALFDFETNVLSFILLSFGSFIYLFPDCYSFHSFAIVYVSL